MNVVTGGIELGVEADEHGVCRLEPFRQAATGVFAQMRLDAHTAPAQLGRPGLDDTQHIAAFVTCLVPALAQAARLEVIGEDDVRVAPQLRVGHKGRRDPLSLGERGLAGEIGERCGGIGGVAGSHRQDDGEQWDEGRVHDGVEDRTAPAFRHSIFDNCLASLNASEAVCGRRCTAIVGIAPGLGPRMIRFIHAADLHLDSPLRGLEAREGAPVALLRGATRRAFEGLVRLAVEERVDFVVIAGDVYDGDWKDYSTGLFFRGQMVRLREAGIAVFLIAGNHDAASVISRRLNLPENVHGFSNRTVESKDVPGHPVVIHGRGFPHRAVPENLAADYPPAVAGKLNLGLLHTSLTGRPDHDTYAPCSEQDLRGKGYGYWALGHVHRPEVVSRDPWIVFAGNCQGRHVREAGPRGCRLVTVNDDLAVESAEMRPLDVVRWEELKVDWTGIEDESEALRRVRAAMEGAVAGAEERLIAARLVIVGHTPLHGSLHRDGERWRAELLACAQDQGAEALWLERIEIESSPVYEVRQLAERDALTRLVLDGLDQARDGLEALPGEIAEMLAVLPAEVRREVEAEWGEGRRGLVLNDVRALILDALGADRQGAT